GSGSLSPGRRATRAPLARRIGRASRDGLGHPALSFMPTDNTFARDLARAFLAGDWSLDDLHRWAIVACGRKRGLRALLRRVLVAFPGPIPADEAALVAFLENEPAVDSFRKTSRRIAWNAPRMTPHTAIAFASELPPLTTT